MTLAFGKPARSRLWVTVLWFSLHSHWIRNLSANLIAAFDFAGILQAAQLGDQSPYPAVQDIFIAIEFSFKAIVRLPAHPLRLRRKIPIFGIEPANRTQPRIDFGLSVMSATVSIQKLRCIGNLPSPSLPAAETCGSRRLPEHGRKPASRGAHEEPLTSAEVARARNQGYLLHEAPNR